MSDSCLIKNWNPISNPSDPEAEVSGALGQLLKIGVASDREKPWEDVFFGIGKCSSDRIARFDHQIDLLRARFKEIRPERLAVRLEELKGNERALWLGVIHYWAYRDEAYLKNVRTPAIDAALSGGPESCVDLEERVSQDVRTGFSKREARLMNGRGLCDGEGATLETYASRFNHLRYFRESYENFLDDLRSGLYSSDSLERGTSLMNMAAGFNLNAVARGSAPITREDLQKVRDDAEGRNPPATSPVSWSDIENGATAEAPLIFRPSDLPVDLMKMASGIEVGPFNLFELLLDTVDYVVLLPNDRFRELRQSEEQEEDAIVHHAHRTIVLRADAAETPGKFLATLAHEAAHRYWFDLNLEENPGRLSLQGPNERFAYAFELGTIYYYKNFEKLVPGEEEILQEMFDGGLERVQNANVRLGLERDDFSLVLWDDDWNDQPFEFFQFYPAANPLPE